MIKNPKKKIENYQTVNKVVLSGIMKPLLVVNWLDKLNLFFESLPKIKKKNECKQTYLHKFKSYFNLIKNLDDLLISISTKKKLFMYKNLKKTDYCMNKNVSKKTK